MPTRPPTHKPPRARVPEGRPSASRRGYGSHWREVRKAYLMVHPLCQAEGCTEAARHVDHRTALAAGGTSDEPNLQALCHSCHSRKTVAHDGGLGHARQPPPAPGGPPQG